MSDNDFQQWGKETDELSPGIWKPLDVEDEWRIDQELRDKYMLPPANFDIRTAFLSDADAERVYKRFPDLRGGPDETCPTCGTTGSYLWCGETHQCACDLQLQLAKHYAKAGLHVGFWRMDLSDYEWKNDVLRTTIMGYLDHFETYRRNRGLGLLLRGDVGCGKTCLASLVLKELVKRGYRCYALSLGQLIDLYCDSWNSADDKALYEAVINAHVLLLDDIGKEYKRKSDLQRSALFDVVDKRGSACNPTFYTTNLTADDVETYYGKATLSRLWNQGIDWEFSAKDYRYVPRSLTEVSGETRPIR